MVTLGSAVHGGISWAAQEKLEKVLSKSRLLMGHSPSFWRTDLWSHGGNRSRMKTAVPSRSTSSVYTISRLHSGLLLQFW